MSCYVDSTWLFQSMCPLRKQLEICTHLHYMMVILVSKVETWSTVMTDWYPAPKMRRKLVLFQGEEGPGLTEDLAYAKVSLDT